MNLVEITRVRTALRLSGMTQSATSLRAAPSQAGAMRSRGGSKPKHQRCAIERAVKHLRERHAIGTHYDKLTVDDLAMVRWRSFSPAYATCIHQTGHG